MCLQGHWLTRSSRPEFKEIRREWKARKKEEDQARKNDEDRQRQAANAVAVAQNGGADPQAGPDPSQPPASYSGTRQLPPIAYANASYTPVSSGGVQQPLPEYGSGNVYNGYSPASQYPPSNSQMYNQRKFETLPH